MACLYEQLLRRDALKVHFNFELVAKCFLERLHNEGHASNGIEGYGFSQSHWLVQFQFVIFVAILVTYLAHVE